MEVFPNSTYAWGMLHNGGRYKVSLFLDSGTATQATHKSFTHRQATHILAERLQCSLTSKECRTKLMQLQHALAIWRLWGHRTPVHCPKTNQL